jgi:flagellar biosynthesis protein FlhA
MRDSGIKPIALVDQSIRPVIAELAFDNASDMFVLGRQEAMGADIDIIGEISADELNAVAQAA